MKKIIWKILLVIGFIPLIFGLIYGINSSINGFSGIYIGCKHEYGLIAFKDSFLLFSYVFWPTYIIGLVLIILSIHKLKK